MTVVRAGRRGAASAAAAKAEEAAVEAGGVGARDGMRVGVRSPVGSAATGVTGRGGSAKFGLGWLSKRGWSASRASLICSLF